VASALISGRNEAVARKIPALGGQRHDEERVCQRRPVAPAPWTGATSKRLIRRDGFRPDDA
jgi:hypothetical protein